MGRRDVYLPKVSLVYFDRRSPESDEIVRAPTPEDFGPLEFEEVEMGRLYDVAAE